MKNLKTGLSKTKYLKKYGHWEFLYNSFIKNIDKYNETNLFNDFVYYFEKYHSAIILIRVESYEGNKFIKPLGVFTDINILSLRLKYIFMENEPIDVISFGDGLNIYEFNEGVNYTKYILRFININQTDNNINDFGDDIKI